MVLMKDGAAVAHVEIAHLALDAARVQAASAADAAATRNLGQQRLAPVLLALRGERPLRAASFA